MKKLNHVHAVGPALCIQCPKTCHVVEGLRHLTRHCIRLDSHTRNSSGHSGLLACVCRIVSTVDSRVEFQTPKKWNILIYWHSPQKIYPTSNRPFGHVVGFFELTSRLQDLLDIADREALEVNTSAGKELKNFPDPLKQFCCSVKDERNK